MTQVGDHSRETEAPTLDEVIAPHTARTRSGSCMRSLVLASGRRLGKLEVSVFREGKHGTVDAGQAGWTSTDVFCSSSVLPHPISGAQSWARQPGQANIGCLPCSIVPAFEGL